MVIERLLSAGSVCVLIATIAAFNEECKRFLAGLLSGDTSTGLFVLGGRALLACCQLRGGEIVARAYSFSKRVIIREPFCRHHLAFVLIVGV